MTIGISKEDLIECLKIHAQYRNTALAHDLEYICTELNPWLPIESAPLNRRIMLFNTSAKSQVFDYLYTEEFRKYYSHWKELSENPKEE